MFIFLCVLYISVCILCMQKGQKVLIVAHGNSLRGLMKYLDDMSEEAVVELNIPTGEACMFHITS